MGQACSCYHNKTGETTYMPPQSVDDTNKSDCLVNEEYVKVVSTQHDSGPKR